ncbi:MAG TPA: OmpA family protein [Candidatus Binatia bacterium]|nr:OmpA family protein [Candidatus Binatia bacterium]
MGVAVPTGQYTRTANVGGTIGFFGGYRFSLTRGVALDLLLQPQFTLLPTKGRLREFSSSLTSTFNIATGPRLVLGEGPWRAAFGGQGGYYRDMSGPLSEDGAGWNVAGEVSYEIFRNGFLGLFARYDQANLLPALDASPKEPRRIFLGGISFDWVWEPEAEVVQAATTVPPPPPPPAPITRKKIVLRGVNFDFDKSNIRPDARPILNEAITTLKGAPSIDITVDGYTDSIGTDAYNMRLSQRRASSVKRYLENGGIAGSRMKPVGHGESDPVASNETADGRAQNRRVELNVVGQ